MKRLSLSQAAAALGLFLAVAACALAQAGRGEGRLTGKVVAEEGTPLAGAEIKITSPRHESLVFEARTDEKGEWVILGLGTGTWRVEARAEGYVGGFQDVNVRQMERNPDVDFILKKAKPSEESAIEDESSFALFEQGNALFAEKKFDEAIAAFRRFLEANPKAYQIHFNIGNALKEKGALAEAREEYELVMTAIKDETEDLQGNELAAKTLAASGETYLKENDIEAAQECFKKSVEIYSKDESLAYNVGEIYFSEGRIDEARAYFEIASQIKPDWSKPYLKLGYVHLNKGDLDKARENLKKFLELDPESPEAGTVRNIIDYIDRQKK
ncbi:MAG: tetratricopeptide repeat protein [Candidatus Aminicenantes bacterium]|nr:tetratricopeptide repeat protein [Candidatus Aminicenantes bacterium]